jgi:hypothetical protein
MLPAKLDETQGRRLQHTLRLQQELSFVLYACRKLKGCAARSRQYFAGCTFELAAHELRFRGAVINVDEALFDDRKILNLPPLKASNEWLGEYAPLVLDDLVRLT